MPVQTTRIYVGGLPYATTEEELAQHFSAAGEVVSATIPTAEDPNDPSAPRRSKGFGFVEMKSLDEAEAAIGMFHGTDMGGRTLTVNEAKPRGEGNDRRSGGGGYSGGNGGGGYGGNRGGNGGGYGRQSGSYSV